MRDVPLFNNEIVKFHVPHMNVIRKYARVSSDLF
ncbi:hypothetical protein BAPA111461_26845 [Bacillus paramycoides]